MRSLRRTLLFLILAIVVLGIAAYVTRTAWLTALGTLLVREDAPARADAILVLAGDLRGERILKACELARQGRAPVVLVSGPMEFYGLNEADMAIAYGTAHGCPSQALQAVRLPALSTQDEARNMEGEFRRRGIRRVIVVTSNYHTARAARIFESQLHGEVEIHTASAPDKYFSPSTWWYTREGQKTLFYEYSKTLAAAIGL